MVTLHHRTRASERSVVTVHRSVAVDAHVARRTLHSHATRQGQGQGQGVDPSGAAFMGGLVGGAVGSFLGYRF